MLTSLFLSRNRISSAGLPALADVVGGLTSLNLSCNALGDGLWQLGRAAALARERILTALLMRCLSRVGTQRAAASIFFVI